MTKFLLYSAKTLLWLLMIIGFLVAGLRLTLANISFFKADIETWAAEELVSGINFSDIRWHWSDVNPVLELEKVAITLPDFSRPVAIDKFSIQFDLWNSLLRLTPVILEIRGDIEKLVIRKDQNKRWWLNDIDLKAATDSEVAANMENLLASMPHYLQLALKRLIIEDVTRQRTHQIDNISVDIQHHHQVTHLQLLANLPEALGGSLQLQSLLKGDTGVIYLKTEQLKLTPITTLLDIPLKNFRRVEVAGEAWVNLSDHHIHSVNGRISINQAVYQPKLDEPAIPFQFAMNFNADRQNQNWQWIHEVETLVVNRQSLPDIYAQWQLKGTQIQGWIKELPISEYLTLAEAYIPDQYQHLLQQSNIQGQLENIWLSATLEAPSDAMIMAKASHLQNKGVSLMPGINQLHADIVYARQQAGINLAAEDLVVDFGDRFRAAFEIDTFHARADIGFFNGEAMLALSNVRVVNQDINVAGRFWLESDFETRPFLSMRLNFEDAIISQKSRYLPVKLLPEAVLNWLDKGIHSGHASNGAVLFHGRLEGIKALNDHYSGELAIDFDLRNSELLFDPDWEIAKRGTGTVRFHNMGVEVDLKSVDYGRIENAQANIKLPNYANAEVSVQVSAQTDLESAMDVWLASPVGVDYRDITADLSEPHGQISADIELLIPIKFDNQQPTVAVTLELDKVAIKAPAVQFSRAQGHVWVTNDTVSAHGKAHYFDDPINIEVTTDAQRQTLIKTNGLIDIKRLLSLLPASHNRALSGKSNWQVDVTIANIAKPNNQTILTVDAHSDLQGTSIVLPAPFSKHRNSRRQTNAKIVLLANEQIVFNGNYGASVKVQGRLEKSDTHNYELAALDIAFSKPLKAESGHGIRLYGNVPVLAMGSWIDHSAQVFETQGLPFLLESVDLTMDKLTLAGQVLRDVNILLTRSETGVTGQIDSAALKGQFFLPEQYSNQNPLTIDMDHIRISKNIGSSHNMDFIPDHFLSTKLHSEIFEYDGKMVNDFEIVTNLDDGSLFIERLNFKHRDVRFESSGYWLYDIATKQQHSHLAVSIKGDKFGQTLAALGFGDTVHNGNINFNGEIAWPAAILSPEWDILSGKAHISLENGILKDVDPGSGRLVGLLSLSALPRRLFLDFSDVLFDGLKFDRIAGDLMLDGQSLYTRNTKMDGPSVKVRVVGKTGIRDRDYDQKIYVTPKIRQTLPLLGNAIGGGSLAWGLVIFQNLFKSSIDKSVELEYSVTGSWDAPVIVQLNKTTLQPELTEERSGNHEK